jgi:Xaa-Pro aminopeptidase
MSYLDGWNKNVLQKRKQKIVNYLSEKELDALVLLDELNIVYATGYFLDIATWERPAAAVIPVDAEPFMVLCELSINHSKYVREKGRGLVEDIRFYQEHPRQTNRLPIREEWTKILCDGLKEKNVRRGLGVDRLSGKFEQDVKAHLPEIKFVRSEEFIRDMRLVKCEEELDLIRKAGMLSDWGQEKYREAIKVDKMWLEIGAEVGYALSVETAKKYPEYHIEARAGGTGWGDIAASPHGVGGYFGAKIKKGDTIVNGISVRLNKYGVENERTFIVGSPTEKQRKIFEVMKEAQIKAVEMCVEGNRLSDIDATAQAVIERAGYGEYIMHRTGHGIGLGGHEYPDDMAYNHRLLKAGMVLSVEPGIYIYGYGGFRHSDTIIVGKNKPEVTTKFTKELDELTIPA